MKVGYARVSIIDQDIATQLAALQFPRLKTISKWLNGQLGEEPLR